VTDYFTYVDDHTAFRADKLVKADLFRGDHLFVGLNCLEAGQSQEVHAHAGADKFYLLISGKARMRVGEEVREVGAGGVVWAPAGVLHGVESALVRTVVLVGMTARREVSGPARS
jgi:quercetin dioxygenase-like cupin family protein